VREFYGVVHHEDAVRGVFITTSTFPQEALGSARGKRLTLIGGSALCTMLGNAGVRVADVQWESARSGPQLDVSRESLTALSEVVPAMSGWPFDSDLENRCRFGSAVETEKLLVSMIDPHGSGAVDAVEARVRVDLSDVYVATARATKALEVPNRTAVTQVAASALRLAVAARIAMIQVDLDEGYRPLLDQMRSESLHLLPLVEYALFAHWLGRFRVSQEWAHCCRAAVHFPMASLLTALLADRQGCYQWHVIIESRLGNWFNEGVGTVGGREKREALWTAALAGLAAGAGPAAERGRELHRQGIWRDAQDAFRAAGQGKPETSLNWKMLADASARLTDYQEASRALHMYVALEPEARDAGAVQECLQRLRDRLGE
jgi:hypothetical protein